MTFSIPVSMMPLVVTVSAAVREDKGEILPDSYISIAYLLRYEFSSDSDKLEVLSILKP